MRRRPGSWPRHAQKIQSRSETQAPRPQAGRPTYQTHSVPSRLGSNADRQGQCGYGELPDCRLSSEAAPLCEIRPAEATESAASETPETFSFIYSAKDYEAPPLLAAGCSTRGNVRHNLPPANQRPLTHDSRPFPFHSFFSIAIHRFLSGTFTLVTTSIMPLAGCIEHGPTVRVVPGGGGWGGGGGGVRTDV